MPDAKSAAGPGSRLASMAALIGAFAGLITAVGGFIQIVHPLGMGLEVEAQTLTPTPTVAPTPTPTATATGPKTVPPTATASATSSGVAGMCVATKTGAVSVTVASFDPAFNDLGLSIGDSFWRLKLPTRGVRIGVTVENQGSANVTLSSQNWRLAGSGTSYPLASPAPSPSPAYTGRVVGPSTRFAGFVTFTGVPRELTSLTFEAKFGTATTTFRLPSTKQDCAP
jgi:hypothetical protein